MRHRILRRVLAPVALAAAAVAGWAWAQEAPAAPAGKYVGAGKCKSCHSAQASGNAHGQWEQSKHAKAFASLGSDAAKAAGKARDVADPQTAPQCLKCHQTAYGVPADRYDKTFDPKAGVQCETCHGPGSVHSQARLKAALTRKKGDPGPTVIPPGEIIGRPEPASCLACHNAESPTFQGFCFRDRVKAVLHLDPRKARDPAELAALACRCEQQPCACTKGDCGGWPTPEEIAKAKAAGAK
jgi:hypothetical protein